MSARDWFGPLAIVLGAAGAVGLLATWLVLGRSWKRLPAIVAHHFDLLGRPDSFGNKRILWVIPILTTVLCVALTILGLWGLSRENEPIERARLNAETLMGAITYLTWTTFFMTRATIDVGLGRRKDLGRWLLPVVLAALALLILASSLRLR